MHFPKTLKLVGVFLVLPFAGLYPANTITHSPVRTEAVIPTDIKVILPTEVKMLRFQVGEDFLSYTFLNLRRKCVRESKNATVCGQDRALSVIIRPRNKGPPFLMAAIKSMGRLFLLKMLKLLNE